MATFSDLITRTITRLSMVPGYGVQTYAEDQIAEMIYHKFVTARDQMWWDDLMEFTTLTVDANGLPTENVVRTLPAVPVGDEIVINKYSDIQHVWRATGDDNPIPSRPRRTNPNRSLYQRTRGPNSTKVIKIWGAQSGEQFTLRYKLYYPMFDADDEVPFDEQLMILGACWDYLEDDGSNPMQIEKFKNLYVSRMETLAAAENGEAILMGAL